MFIVPLQWQRLPRWMHIARAMSAKFKAFSFPVIKSYSVVPVFRSSVIPRFPVSRQHYTMKNTIYCVVTYTLCECHNSSHLEKYIVCKQGMDDIKVKVNMQSPIHPYNL